MLAGVSLVAWTSKRLPFFPCFMLVNHCMQRKNSTYAGDSSTWKAEDWAWDAATLTARPKRRSARLEELGASTAVSACQARDRLASHLESDSQAATSAFPPFLDAQDQAVLSNNSSSSSKCGSGRQCGSAGGKAARISKAQMNSRRAVCQVDGCNRDLSTLTYYHQRNR